MVFDDFEALENCLNIEQSMGEMCVKCNKCGRFNQNKIYDKFIVIKKEDLNYINSPFKVAMLQNDLKDIREGRMLEGKKINEYLVVNKDEPYAALVEKLILRKDVALDIKDLATIMGALIDKSISTKHMIEIEDYECEEELESLKRQATTVDVLATKVSQLINN